MVGVFRRFSTFSQQLKSDEGEDLDPRYEEHYRDSQILDGEEEVQEGDFRRVPWPTAFVARLEDYLADENHASVGAAAVRNAIAEALLTRGGKSYRVWLGPLAREWLRHNAEKLSAYLGGKYADYVTEFNTRGR